MKKYINTSTATIDYPLYNDIFENFYKYDYIPDYDELVDYYDITEEEYQKIVDFFDGLNDKIDNGEIKLYVDDDREEYLELSDNHTYWEIEKEIDEDELEYLTDDYADKFNEFFGTPILFRGRSGRHICVDFSLTNVLRYDWMREKWAEYEEEFISVVNEL